MKHLSLLFIIIMFNSCTRFLIGEKKLTYNEFTPYIKAYTTSYLKDQKFFLISFEKLKEFRGYPGFIYLGSENNYSFFGTIAKLWYKDEIILIALPDSICINKYPRTIDLESKINRFYRHGIFVNNKVVVHDSPKIH